MLFFCSSSFAFSDSDVIHFWYFFFRCMRWQFTCNFICIVFLMSKRYAHPLSVENQILWKPWQCLQQLLPLKKYTIFNKRENELQKVSTSTLSKSDLHVKSILKGVYFFSGLNFGWMHSGCFFLLDGQSVYYKESVESSEIMKVYCEKHKMEMSCLNYKLDTFGRNQYKNTLTSSYFTQAIDNEWNRWKIA